MNDQQPSEKPTGAYLSFLDASGARWIVWKIKESAVDEIRGRGGAPESPSLGRAWLIFLSPSGETRRLAPVPTNWRDLSDAELERLAGEAKPFKRRT
jgi:hypothetical protein